MPLWHTTIEVIFLNYGIYKNARNASWQCLIDCGVSTLPIRPVIISEKYGVVCVEATKKQLGGTFGTIHIFNKEIFISFNVADPLPRQRFTILHELGHYLLGHLGDRPLERSEQECRPEEEQAADKFAADVLMPACVLWGLNIHTAGEIAQLCGVSMQAAEIRAERMKVLYRRNMFLSHPLEREVFERFKPWIDSQVK